MSSPVSIATRKFQLQQNRGDPAWACKECQKSLMRIAVLDDYQSVALTMADWSPLQGRAEVTVFSSIPTVEMTWALILASQRHLGEGETN